MTQFEQELTKIKPSLLQLLAALTNLVNSIGEQKAEIKVSTNIDAYREKEPDNKLYKALNEKAFFTVKEFMSLTGCSRSTAYKQVNLNEIPVVRVGRKVMIPAWYIQKLIEGPAK